MWAETTRIVSQVLLILLFAAFLVFVIRQAVNSPNVTQKIEEAQAEVDVPGKRCVLGPWARPLTRAA